MADENVGAGVNGGMRQLGQKVGRFSATSFLARGREWWKSGNPSSACRRGCPSGSGGSGFVHFVGENGPAYHPHGISVLQDQFEPLGASPHAFRLSGCIPVSPAPPPARAAGGNASWILCSDFIISGDKHVGCNPQSAQTGTAGSAPPTASAGTDMGIRMEVMETRATRPLAVCR